LGVTYDFVTLISEQRGAPYFVRRHVEYAEYYTPYSIAFVTKDRVFQYALEKGYIQKSKITMLAVAEAILNVIDGKQAIELISRFKDKIGYSATELKNKLHITKQERQKWTQKNLLMVTGTYETRAYGQYLTCPVYDALQIIELTEKEIDE